ncbi:WYL domain-containing protein [uncultured Rothia sp.]|uniref:helix-turn-helix transcriptional regulator n=1 Tax=uncultured Rothia sp. TaxID=316088 RepID=UPI0028F0C3D2|nr:WYL domain-containing protein [uncultured Rothia sp.]
MSTAAQLFMTLNRLATVAEAPDEATRRNGISRDEFLSLLGIKTSAPGAALSEASERAFERAKQTLRDAGARITHFTTDTSGRYRLNAEAPDSLTAWNPTAKEFRLLNAELRGWEGTELQDEAYRILRKIALTSEHLTDEALTAANVTRIEEIKRDNQPPLTKTVKQRARDLHAYREHIQRLHFSDDPHLYELFTAYAQRKTLNFTYQGSGGDIKTYEKVSVAGLIYSYGSWYLVAHFPLGNKTPEERKTYTYRTDRIRSLDVFSSTDPAPINPAYEARTRLKKISGYEETLAVLDPNPGTGDPAAPFTVPSYGAVDSAIDATCAGWLIQPRHNTGNSASGASVTGRQQDSHAAQQELLRDLIALHTGEPETPTKWFPTTQRSRNDALDDLDDLILALHRADRWADVHDEAPMPLNKLNPLYRVDNDNAAKLDKIINAIYEDFDEVPFYSEAKNPDAPTPARTNLLPEFGDGAASLTLLNYARLTDTELAILVFTLSAADLMYPGDPRPAAILAALAEAYPRTTDYAKHLLFAPEDPLLQDARAALASGRALTITYGTRDAERVVDPVALTLHRDRLYLHAWCRASEARHLATLSESPAAENVKPASAAGEKAASAGAEPTAVEPVFWRNFRLTRISSYAPAGEAQAHYIGPNHDSTVNDWHAKQHKTTTNPSVELRIHPTDHTPGGEALENLTVTYKRRSAEHARKGTKTTHVRVHYNNIAGAGDKNIIDTVIAHRGSLEITGPAHLRAALLEHLTALANANPASPREN